MTDTLELVRTLSDAEWAKLAGGLLTGPFPLARPEQRRPAAVPASSSSTPATAT